MRTVGENLGSLEKVKDYNKVIQRDYCAAGHGCIRSEACENCFHIISDSICMCVGGIGLCDNCGLETPKPNWLKYDPKNIAKRFEKSKPFGGFPGGIRAVGAFAPETSYTISSDTEFAIKKNPTSMSDAVEIYINNAIEEYDGSYELGNEFEGLLGFGELVDRLTIVNNKLYTLKDKQADSKDEKFLAKAAVLDVALVEERARLKKCIDVKVLAIIQKCLNGDKKGGMNEEVKNYGGDIR